MKHSLQKIQSEYSFTLPPQHIATQPASPRDSARLLTYTISTKTLAEDTFLHITSYIPPHAVLVFNETKVIPARLVVTKESGGKARITYLSTHTSTNTIRVLSDRKLTLKTKLFVIPSIFFHVTSQDEKYYYLTPSFSLSKLQSVFNRYGIIPLPPYIKNSPLSHSQLKEKYQTIFAKITGSVAAPTASLHFTKRLLRKIRLHGCDIAFVTLHVNEGTFAPLTQDALDTHTLHTEQYEISPHTAKLLQNAKKQGRPIVAVGTTVVRTLESASDDSGVLKKLSGDTNIFIHPPYRFKFVDEIITNFHVPSSSLMMLVSAFIGRETLLSLYAYAIKKKFRFFSFGDGMYIKK